MSTLTNALDRIFNWLQNHKPEFSTSFLPGLTLAEIEEKLQALPFRLPQEVYDLYQWRNGMQNDEMIFVYHYFLTLDQAIELALMYPDNYGLNSDFFKQHRQAEGYPSYVFPLFEFEGEYFAVGANTTELETYPVFHIHHGETFAFTSLTNMILTIAECYETGVYTTTPDGDFELDYQQFGAIRRKYNPGAAELIYADEK
ncbi:MAG TPA: SMI1/KNR4 family protein [Nostocaceae cyanobacterium]|nr:SMI1/KNR4 family protein [Nostocaceae cyanobacterium]